MFASLHAGLEPLSPAVRELSLFSIGGHGWRPLNIILPSCTEGLGCPWWGSHDDLVFPRICLHKFPSHLSIWRQITARLSRIELRCFRQRLGKGRYAFFICFFVMLFFCAQYIHNICPETFVSRRPSIIFILLFFCAQHMHLYLFVICFRSSRNMKFNWLYYTRYFKFPLTKHTFKYRLYSYFGWELCWHNYCTNYNDAIMYNNHGSWALTK